MGYRGIVRELPVDKLPRGLGVQLGMRLQPPKLHYGWPITLQWLADVGKKKNCLFLERTTVEVPDVERMHYCLTTKGMQKKICEELGINYLSTTFCHAYTREAPEGYFLSVWDNYIDGTQNPPPEDMEKLQRWLGLEQGPKWHLNMEDMQRWDIRFVQSTWFNTFQGLISH